MTSVKVRRESCAIKQAFLIHQNPRYSGGCIRDFITYFSRTITESPSHLVAHFLPLQPDCQGSHPPWPRAQLRRECLRIHMYPGHCQEGATQNCRDSLERMSLSRNSHFPSRKSRKSSMTFFQPGGTEGTQPSVPPSTVFRRPDAAIGLVRFRNSIEVCAGFF